LSGIIVRPKRPDDVVLRLSGRVIRAVISGTKIASGPPHSTGDGSRTEPRRRVPARARKPRAVPERTGRGTEKPLLHRDVADQF
jgi:hypothetical protein